MIVRQIMKKTTILILKRITVNAFSNVTCLISYIIFLNHIKFILSIHWRAMLLPSGSMWNILDGYKCNKFQQKLITRSSMLQFEVLIGKLPSIDGLPTSSVVVSEISPLSETYVQRPHAWCKAWECQRQGSQVLKTGKSDILSLIQFWLGAAAY